MTEHHDHTDPKNSSHHHHHPYGIMNPSAAQQLYTIMQNESLHIASIQVVTFPNVHHLQPQPPYNDDDQPPQQHDPQPQQHGSSNVLIGIAQRRP